MGEDFQVMLQRVRHVLATAGDAAVSKNDCEWACFTAHQAAEQALLTVYQQQDQDACGNGVSVLLDNLPADAAVRAELSQCAERLERYADAGSHRQQHHGGPFHLTSTAERLREAVESAERIVGFCSTHLR